MRFRAPVLLSMLLTICLALQGLAFAGGMSCTHAATTAATTAADSQAADPHAHHHAAAEQVQDLPPAPGHCQCGCDCADRCMSGCAAAIAVSMSLPPSWTAPLRVAAARPATAHSSLPAIPLRPPISI